MHNGWYLGAERPPKEILEKEPLLEAKTRLLSAALNGNGFKTEVDRLVGRLETASKDGARNELHEMRPLFLEASSNPGKFFQLVMELESLRWDGLLNRRKPTR